MCIDFDEKVGGEIKSINSHTQDATALNSIDVYAVNFG
jgi:hypothetical protein